MTQASFETEFQVALEEAGFEGLTKKDVQAILDALGETVQAGLRRKVDKTMPDGKVRKVADVVVVRALGRWSIADRPARMGRNPATGEAIKIKASKKLKIAAPKSIRDGLGVK